MNPIKCSDPAIAHSGALCVLLYRRRNHESSTFGNPADESFKCSDPAIAHPGALSVTRVRFVFSYTDEETTKAQRLGTPWMNPIRCSDPAIAHPGALKCSDPAIAATAHPGALCVLLHRRRNHESSTSGNPADEPNEMF